MQAIAVQLGDFLPHYGNMINGNAVLEAERKGTLSSSFQPFSFGLN
jgi:hypothetical protein